MHLLDRLAALAILLQLGAVVFFGWQLSTQLATTRAQLGAVEAKLYAAPTPTVEALTPSPSPTLTLKQGFNSAGSSATKTYTVSPTK